MILEKVFSVMCVIHFREGHPKRRTLPRKYQVKISGYAKSAQGQILSQNVVSEKSTGAKFITEFTRERYNLSSNYVKKSIETLSDNTAKYQICSTCDRKLMKCSMLNCSSCERLCARRELREVKDQIMICKDLI